MSDSVLIVDDEPAIVLACRKFLGPDRRVETADGGPAALAALAERGPFAVVVSDLEMPGMDGIRLLARVRAEYPDTVRLLLTGYADTARAIAAVNHGGVFRFLTKPCAPADFVATVDAAVAQHRLVTAERELLDKTLRGSVQMLAEVFALADREEFGRAVRVQQLARDLATEAGAPAGWELEVAAVLSRLGSIVVPDDMMRAARQGARLTAEEQRRVDGIPEVAITLLRHVPRLDPVVEIISHLGTPFDARAGGGNGGAPPLGARLLKVAHDFDALVSRGLPAPQAADRLRERTGWYDPAVLDGLSRLIDRPAELVSAVVGVGELTPRMVLAEDLYSDTGALLLKRGVTINEPIRLRLDGLVAKGSVSRRVRVLVPRAAAPDHGGQ